MTLRSRLKQNCPWVFLYIYRKIYYLPKDVPAAIRFLSHGTKSPTTFGQRLGLVRRFYSISYHVDCPHTEHEFLAITRRILDLGPAVAGSIVECGAFHGGSTAKLSLVAKLAGRTLEVFDSFVGMPENQEAHGKSIYGREHHFPKGSHAVGLEAVKGNVTKHGDVSRCTFHKGWFKDTLPGLRGPVAAACINVDLVQSTSDCLKDLYPLVSSGGLIFSQDGHFPWVIGLLADDSFWKTALGISAPPMEGLGTSKLVVIAKTGV